MVPLSRVCLELRAAAPYRHGRSLLHQALTPPRSAEEVPGEIQGEVKAKPVDPSTQRMTADIFGAAIKAC